MPRPDVVSKFFSYSNSVDVHNHLRQACLRLEKNWITTDCWFRIVTTVVGVNAVDMYRLARYHGILLKGKLKLVLDKFDYNGVNKCSMQEFAGILSIQFMYLANAHQRQRTQDGVRRRPWNSQEEEANENTTAARTTNTTSQSDKRPIKKTAN